MIVSLEQIADHLNMPTDIDGVLLTQKLLAAHSIIENAIGVSFTLATVGTVTTGYTAYAAPVFGTNGGATGAYDLAGGSYEPNIASTGKFDFTGGAYVANFTNTGKFDLVDSDYYRNDFHTGAYDLTVAEVISNAPAALKEAVLQMAAYLYENRELVVVGVSVNTLPMGIADLISPYKVWSF